MVINQDIIWIVFLEGFQHNYQNLHLLFSCWTKQDELLSILFKNFQNNPVDGLFMRGIIFATSFFKVPLPPSYTIFLNWAWLVPNFFHLKHMLLHHEDFLYQHKTCRCGWYGRGQVGEGWRNNTIKRVQEMV